MLTVPTRPHQFWVGVVSREHVHLGVAGGFVQLNHGKKAPVQRLRAGDGLVIYSPRTAYPDGEPLQHFTAIGIVSTGEVYQVQMTEDFKPYRVDAFRFGYARVPDEDFKLIAKAMSVNLELQPMRSK